MKFQQKRMATQAWFDFEEKELHHRVRDNNGDVEFAIEYGSIPAATRSVFERNNWLRNVGLIWCVLGLINIGLALIGSGELAGSGFWLLIGFGCLAFYRLTWSEYSVIETEEGSIWILNDKQHDEIIETIKERRKVELLAWYRSMNFEDDPVREVTTVEWLVKQKVLSIKEGESRIAEIRGGEALLLSNNNEEESSRKIH